MTEIKKTIPFKYRLKARLFRFPVVGDWIYNWDDQQALKKLNQKYLPLIQAAREAKNEEEANAQEERLYHESRLLEDASAGRNSEKLLAKARKWGVIPPIKKQDSKDWYLSNHTGDWILVPEAQQTVKREINDEIRGSRDEVRKNTTLVIAIMSFLLSTGLLLINIFTLRSNRHAVEVTEKNGKNQSEGMQRQLQTTQTQLELQQRPWIKIMDVQTRGNGPIIPALSFQDAMGHQQATFQLKVSVKNIGHSVAEITVRPGLFFPLWDGFGKSVPDEQKRFCNSDFGKATSGYYPSFVLFPDEPFDWYGAASQLIDSRNTTKFGNAAYVLPVVIVCVNYRLKSLPNTYQTSVVYEVFRKDNRTRFFEPGIGKAADKVFLIRNPVDDYAY